MASLVKNVLHDAYDQGSMISIELLGTRSRGKKKTQTCSCFTGRKLWEIFIKITEGDTFVLATPYCEF